MSSPLSFTLTMIDDTSGTLRTITGNMDQFATTTTQQGAAAGTGFSSQFGEKMKTGVKLAAAAGGVAVAAAFLEAVQQERVTDKMAAQLGLSDEENKRLGGLAGQIYADAYGDSLEGVTEGLQAVYSGFPELQAQGNAALDDVTKKALTFASVFETDVTQAVNTASMVVKQGLAEDAAGAFDLMTAASQKLPAEMRGELPAIMNEYGQFFDTLGFTGNQAFSQIVKASDLGAIGMDKWGDSLKEFTIRATDGASAVDTYAKLGLSAEDMSNKILAGGKPAQEALQQIVAGLQGIVDPTERANAAITFFGTPLEDLGTSNIPAFLDGLSGTESALGNVTGATEKMSDTLNDNAATRIESFKRQAQQTFVNLLGDKVVPILSTAAGWIGRNSAVIVPLVTVLGTLAGGVYLVNTAIKVWTATQAAFNVVMGLNPVVLITLAVIALIAAVVLAWQHSETFRDIVTGSFNTVLSVVQGVWGWVSANWPLLLAIITGPIGIAVGIVIRYWDEIKAGFSGVTGWIGDRVGDVAGFVTGLPEKMGNFGVTLLNIITAPFRAAYGWIASAWNSTVGKLSFSVPSWVPGFGGNGWGMPKIPDTMPAIPKLARGGVIVAGDNPSGIEAVIPLEKWADHGLFGRGRQGGGDSFYFDLSGLMAGTPEQLARAIVDIVGKARANGRLDRRSVRIAFGGAE